MNLASSWFEDNQRFPSAVSRNKPMDAVLCAVASAVLLAWLPVGECDLIEIQMFRVQIQINGQLLWPRMREIELPVRIATPFIVAPLVKNDSHSDALDLPDFRQKLVQ